MGLMVLNLATLNARGLRDQSKCETLRECYCSGRDSIHLHGELKDDFVIFLAYSRRCNAEISRIVRRSLNVIVSIVFAEDGGRLFVVNVAVKSVEFQVTAIYALNIAEERLSFFRRLAPFLDDPKQLVLVGDWNAILDPK